MKKISKIPPTSANEENIIVLELYLDRMVIATYEGRSGKRHGEKVAKMPNTKFKIKIPKETILYNYLGYFSSFRFINFLFSFFQSKLKKIYLMEKALKILYICEGTNEKLDLVRPARIVIRECPLLYGCRASLFG